MKRIVFRGILLLSFITSPLYGFRITSVEEVIRMHRAGVSEELIEAFVEGSDPFAVTAEDVIAMEHAGLSPHLIESVLLAADPIADPLSDGGAESIDEAWHREEDSRAASSQGDWCLTFDPPLVRFYSEYYFPDWLWNPFWYMPRLDGRIAGRPDPRAERQRGEASHPDSPRSELPRGSRPRPARPFAGEPVAQSAEQPRREPAKSPPANVNSAIAPSEPRSPQGERAPHQPMRPNL
jgi:hypothetical protein